LSHKIVLKDAYKGYTLDQDKIITPEETVQHFRARLKEVDLDILERTLRIDNGRLGIPVYFSICGKDALEVIGTKKQMGKGCTPQQSEASAVMELAERFSFFSFCKNPANFLVDTYRNVKDRALPLDMIALSVHDQSEDGDRAKEIFSSLPLKWTWAYNLTAQQEVLVPFNWFYTINEFNGPSAGNCVEEALSQGISEIVERHVSSLVSRNRLRVPGISLKSISDPVALDLVRKYETIGVKLFANDFSLDTGIPSVGVLAYDPATFPAKSEIVWTAGTTPSPHKALIRALTEVAQLAGDFNTSSNYVASGLPKFTALEEADFVMHPGVEVPIQSLPDLSNDNIRVEVENCVSALSRAGLSVLVVNVTHARLQIPSFYTIIPGAHFRERAAGTSLGLFSAKLIAESGNPLWAIQELEKMNQLLPRKYYIQFFLGTSHLALEEPATALPFFEKALALDPKEQDVPSIYSYMGQCLKDLGQYREAIAAVEKAEALDRERTDVYNLMGFCYYKLKEHEKAIDCFRRVLELNPASAIDYANIGSNYRDMGDSEKAVSFYRLALDLDPGIDFARENLKKLEAEKADPREKGQNL
jgi:ribosomal protein S12 methylthiotransferase accessory factor